jgi:hypothetical protein
MIINENFEKKEIPDGFILVWSEAFIRVTGENLVEKAV